MSGAKSAANSVAASAAKDAEPGGCWERTRRKAWRGLRVVVVWLMAAAGLIAIANLVLRSGLDLRSVHASVRAIRPWGIGLQVIAGVLLIWRWPTLVDWAVRTGRATEADRPALLGWRRRLAALVVGYLLLVPIGPVALWEWTRAVFGQGTFVR